MEMLKDNETTKEVSLFVTKQRMAIMASKSKKASTKSAPTKTKRRKSGAKSKECLHVIQTKSKYANDIDQQHDDDIQEPSGIGVVAIYCNTNNVSCITTVCLFSVGDGDELHMRKGTVLTQVWNLQEGKRIVVKCNKLGQPIGKEGGLLEQFLGTVARNGGYCPVDIKDWRKVKKDNAATMLQLIQTKFLYPRTCENWILKSIGENTRQH